MTSRVAVKTTSKRAFNERGASPFIPKRRKQFSTIIIVPSTSRPKSKAPKLIKFALTRVCTIPVIVINIANGITKAVKNAALKLPSNTNNTTITKMAPSSRLV